MTIDPLDLNPGDPIKVTIDGARFVGIVDGWNVMQYTTLAGGREIVHELHFGPGWPGHVVERTDVQQ